MAVLQSTDYLSIYATGIILIHATIRLTLEETMSGTSRYILHDKNDLVFCLYGFIKLCDVWMVEALH